MRIDEITMPDSFDTVDQYLRAHGYTRIDHHYDTGVYTKPGIDGVLKVFSQYDQAYVAFAKLAMQNQSNPHFPRFHSKILPLNDDCVAVRMERLAELHGEEAETVAEAVCDIAYYISRTRSSKPRFNEEYEKKIVRATDILAKYPDLARAVHLIDQKLVAHGFKLDYKFDNIMMRGQTLVILDPIKGNNN